MPSPRSSRQQSRLLLVTELPAWMRDNDYVRSSYRPHLPSLRACFRSAFFNLNNDTINVWSHCIAFFVFLSLSFLLLGPQTSVARHIPRIATACHSLLPDLPPLPHVRATLRRLGLPHACVPPHHLPSLEPALRAVLHDHRLGMLPLLLAACFCMLASTLFHAFWVYSPHALRLLGKLDFLGISVLCSGHALSAVFYLFYCSPPHVARRYYALVAVLELLTVVAILAPGFGSPRARPVRTAVFCALGSSVAIPIVHAGVLHRWTTYEFQVAMLSAMTSLAFYFAAAVLYVSRFPECCNVGMHDRFFASHQLMHLMVVVGVAIHLRGCYTLMAYRLENGCIASPLL